MTLGACAVLAVSAVLTGTQAEASAPSRPDSQSRSAPWQPEAAEYGVSQAVTIPVTMNDGVVISTEVVYPTIPATGALAPGKFPVLLTQNPYGDPAGALQAGHVLRAAGVHLRGLRDPWHRRLRRPALVVREPAGRGRSGTRQLGGP